MVKLTTKGIKKGTAVVPDVALTEANVAISGVVTGTKELADSVLTVAVVSSLVGPTPVAANGVVSRVVVFRTVVGLDPSP